MVQPCGYIMEVAKYDSEDLIQILVFQTSCHMFLTIKLYHYWVQRGSSIWNEFYLFPVKLFYCLRLTISLKWEKLFFLKGL